jgi:mono/diheme cytochrome c family protein
MQYPMFQVPFLGNGMTIALDAVLHVMLSHGIAIGVFSLIVLSELLSYRRQSAAWEKFAHDLLKFVTIIITGVGAITGVGIWFYISTLEPRGTGEMLRLFFWPWFIEWFAFAGEVIVLVTYYFTWNHWVGSRKKRHIWLGFSNIIFAVISAVLITGILGFMLTSDAWPWGLSFWQAYFNGSFFPQFILRIGAAYTLGSLITIAYLLFTQRDVDFRREALSLFGKVTLAGTSLAAIGAAWYFSIIPPNFKVHAIFSVVTSNLSQQSTLFWIVNILAGLGLLGLAFLAIRKLHVPVRALVLPTIILTAGFFVEFERIREFIRGPYIMPGYMYANQVLLSEEPFFNQNGLLANSYWYNAVGKTDPVSQGMYLFGQNCSVCHTIGGINDLATRVRGRSQDGIRVIIAHTHELLPFMAPFSGTQQEQEAMAAFLFQLSNKQIDVGIPTRFIDVQPVGGAQ